MKLHRLHLQNFRGVADREVEFPERGVVIVQGPNEVGKTSMMEALDLLLNEKDSTRKQAVKDVQPVGRDVGTAVTAEISAGKYRFIYSKQWLKNAATELKILAPRPESLTGVQAHERVVQMLSEAVDLDLFDALRVMQGRRVDVQVELRGNSALRAALEAASGTAFSTDEGVENLVAAIEAEYRKYFTGGGRPTGEYRVSEEALVAAQAEVVAAEAAMAEAEEQVARHEQLEADIARLATNIADARKKLETNQERFDQLEQHRVALAEAQKILANAEVTFEGCKSALKARHELQATRSQRQTDLQKKKQQQEEADKQAADATKKLSEQNETVVQLEAARNRLRESATEQERVLTDARSRLQYERESERLAQVDAVQKRQNEAEAALEKFQVYDGLLDRVVEADKQVQIAETVLDDTSAQVALTATRPEAITVNGAQAQIGEDGLQLAVSKPLTLEIGDNITLAITPAQGGETRAAAAEQAREGLRAMLVEAGVEDLAAARASNAEHRKNLSDKAAAAAQLAGLLGSDSRSGLQARVDLLHKKISEADLKAQVPADAIEVLEADLERTQLEVAEAEGELEAAQDLKVELQDALTNARVGAATAKSERESAAAEFERVDKELDAAVARAATEKLESDHVNAQQEFEKARDDLDLKQKELEQHDPQTVAELLENSVKSVARLEEEHVELREEISRSQGQLELIGSQGRQEALDEALTAQEAAEQKHNRITRHARAAQLLHETVQHYQQETWQRYVAPFQERITGLGRLVFGADVHFDISPDLEILSRTLRGDTVHFPALSTGAQEQIGILSRLACAQLVSSNGGVPVMIDDALGNSDPTRLEGLGAVLTRAGRDAQVIVLTCTPDRYRDVGEAEVIRL